MTTTSRPVRAAFIPVSLLVFGLFLLSGSPTTFAAGMVLFLVAGLVLSSLLVLRTELPATLVPNPWPNSGYRNISKRRTGS